MTQAISSGLEEKTRRESSYRERTARQNCSFPRLPPAGSLWEMQVEVDFSLPLHQLVA